MNVLKEMFGSKKAITGAVTVVVNLVLGFLPAETLDTETKLALITAISGIAAAYLIGQGVADNGKSAKKLEIAVASASLTPTPEVPDAGADPGATTPA